MFPAFDRYGGFTDLKALNEWSSKPLRKSVRVNTVKSSVEAFKTYAKQKKWSLTPVPWCPEAFYIERDNREDALGKDLLHLLGHIYMQEAASMLPPALLNAQPGDHILDMSSAPGSKTTQMGARMLGRGVIVANDVQEKRLWTLKSSLHRCGVYNNIVTKKVGQWFARHMTEGSIKCCVTLHVPRRVRHAKTVMRLNIVLSRTSKKWRDCNINFLSLRFIVRRSVVKLSIAPALSRPKKMKE